MTTMADLLGTGRAPVAKLRDVNDKVKGRITDARVEQETDFTTRSPKFLIELPDEKSGELKWQARTAAELTPQQISTARPIFQIVLTLDTENGPQRVFLNRWKLDAAKLALKAAIEQVGKPLTEFEVGGEFGIKVVSVNGNKRVASAVYIPPQVEAPTQSEEPPF